MMCGCGHLGFSDGGDGGTSLDATISTLPGATIMSLDARLAFATLDPGALYAMPADGGTPTLPTDAVFPLPDVSGSLTITLDAADTRYRELTASATVDIVAGQRQTVALVIGDDLPASCLDGVTDGGESDTDCGGPCPACAVGSDCLVSTDCLTGSCIGEVCEPATGPPSWLPIHDMPLQRIGLAAVLAGDDRIYVFGGSLADDTTEYAEVDVYDPSRDLWGTAPALPTPRERIAGAIDGAGILYAIGGHDINNVFLTTVESFMPGQTQWNAAPSLPTPRGFVGAATDANGTVFATGGVSAIGTQISNNDSLGATWTARAALPAVRGDHAAARASDGILYAIGGAIASRTASVVGYDPTADAWITLATMQHVRSDLAAATGPDGRVYAIGGFDGTQAVMFVEAVRPSASWIDVAPLSTGRDSCAAAVGPDGRIFVFGGRVNVDGQSSAEAYGPRFQIGAAAGAVGDSLVVTGANFAANATVVIYFDNVPVERVTTDPSGNFAATSVTVPALASGEHGVQAIDDHASYPITLPFTIE